MRGIDRKTPLIPEWKEAAKLYVANGERRTEAVKKVYPDYNDATAASASYKMFNDKRMIHYIKYIRHHVELEMKIEPRWRANLLKRAASEAMEKGKYIAAINATAELNKLFGYNKFVRPFDLSHYDTLQEKMDVVYNSFSEGEISLDAYATLLNGLKNVEPEKLAAKVEELLKKQFDED